MDIFGILKAICSLANGSVIIETNNPEASNVPMIMLIDDALMVSAKNGLGMYTGISALPNKAAIDLIMNINGFVEEARIWPERITGSIDGYHNFDQFQHRFISKYIKSISVNTLDTLIHNDNLEV